MLSECFVPSLKGGATGATLQKSGGRRGVMSVSTAPPVGQSESDEVSRISGVYATQITHNSGLSQRYDDLPSNAVD